ncbi:MAG: GAF domain-containing protein [Leptodesmis sp.]|uniref:GAF domain-containing protein n=1 Tax=Leptodesmis sp. TaxID=3100501 RepID=UPI003D13A6B0
MHTSESAPLAECPDRPTRFKVADEPAYRSIQTDLQTLAAQCPDRATAETLQRWMEQLGWVQSFHESSQMLVAAIEPVSFKVQYANHAFCQLLGIEAGDLIHPAERGEDLKTLLSRLLSEADFLALQQLYRRHLLHLILRQFYSINVSRFRLLEVPAMLTLPSSLSAPRYIKFWLRSDQLKIHRINSELDEFADLELMQRSVQDLEAMLTDPVQLKQLEQQICLHNYQIQGQLLLEGLDVTAWELIRQTTQLLIDRNSILRPQKFCQVNQQLQSLFRAQNSFILTIEENQFRVFTLSPSCLETQTYPIATLQSTCLMPSLQTNQVTIISDLEASQRTELEHQLWRQEARSLLLIPLSCPVPIPGTSDPLPSDLTQTLGLVGVLSDRPYHFDGLDCSHAEQLIPALTRALTSAQQQLVQQRFITNIHPAVEWRFLQEAERRSLGLPAEPIVFDRVYPLYGLSDIRGSSEARNRAIQADLLEQLRLGLAVVEAACQGKKSALGEQIRLDLLERIRRLQEKITVEAEVTETRYLKNHLEVYFDYFAQCGEQAVAAIAAYQQACDNEQQCFYQARADYDRTIGQINARLKETWEDWQQRMQQITPHYCDVEATDGIDHMIYAGQSIDPNFSKFQLRSLRYEQLRAMCACARTALQLQQEYDTTLQVTHLVLVQDCTVDIFHDETTEKLFDVRGTRDTRYEIVKKRIDKARDEKTQARITQPETLTLVYSTHEELEEYQQYLHYLMREGLVDSLIEQGTVEALQGVTGLKFMRVRVLPDG